MGLIKLRLQLSALILFFILSIPAGAQPTEYNHPELEWKSFETEHFFIHYTVGTKRTALMIAKIAEEIHPGLTKLYDYTPNKKISFVVRDTDDYSNGGAYFFDNKVEIWASNLDYIMRGTTNWLRNVVTHEYSHMISIQKMIKSNLTFPFGFLQYFSYEKEKRKDVVRGFPNTVMIYPISSIILPVWFAEGVAQYQANATRYDYLDPHREMILRDRILNDNLLTYNEMSVFGKCSNGNESSYNHGLSFVHYLSHRFGEPILGKIAQTASHWDEFTFESAFEAATGFRPEVLYTDWKDSLEQTYSRRTEVISQNTVAGKPIEKNGSANLYPIWSPDGKQMAYVSNAGQDYFSKNKLILFDPATNTRKTLSSGIKSSLSWSPDGRYLVYSLRKLNKFKSHYNDLFVYDLRQDKEIRLTKNMRAINPDFSHDGKRIVFVSATNGLNQLNVLHLEDVIKSDINKKAWISTETGRLSLTKQSDEVRWRTVEYSGTKLTQLLAFEDGRQIFHPRWSNDDNLIVFDTAIEYGRNIGAYDWQKKSFSLILEAEEELRYPCFQSGSDWLYYASSKTGIYNIYRRDLRNNKTELLTNVPGGAMMPSVNANGGLVYSLYDSAAYQIYKLDQPQALDPKLASYDPNYLQYIPQQNFDLSLLTEPEIYDYKQKFSDIHIFPRLWIDYGTFKPGFLLTAMDVLNKYNLITSAAVNSDFDYDLYGYFDTHEFGPTLFAEAYNISANIYDDTLNVSLSNQGGNSRTYYSDINFNLSEVHTGLELRLFDVVNFRAKYIWRRYAAKIKQKKFYSTLTDDFTPDHFTFHYTYLKGQAFEWSLLANHPRIDKNKDINPTGGYYVHFTHSLQSNDFLTDFALDYINAERFKNYTFNLFELDAEKYFENPFLKQHSLSLRWNAGLIDRKVHSFFDLYAGGLIGMKGYSFFSIEGRYKSILTATYRFPLWQHMDMRLGNLSLDKLYLGVFYDWGNAWSSNKNLQFNDFKRDIGLQLRLDSFSYSLFPTRFFAEAVYPLDKASNYDQSRDKVIDYPREWRYYFGLLYEFDLREKMTGFLHRAHR